MTTISLTRVTQALAVAAALLATAAPALAGVDGRSPDTRDAVLSAHSGPVPAGVVTDGRSADTLDAAITAHAQAPDWFERYAAAHPYGAGTQFAVTGTVTDGRSPDTLDAASAPRPVEVVQPAATGFDWGDAGIGAALGIGTTIGLACVLAMWLVPRRRQRAQAI